MSVRTNYWLSYQGRAARWQRWATTCTNKQTPREFPRREEGERKCCCFRKLSIREKESKWSGIKAAKWNTPDSLLLNRVFHLEPRGWFLTGAGWGAHECRCHSGETSKNVFNWRICAISWNYTKMHKQPCKMAQSKKEKKKKRQHLVLWCLMLFCLLMFVFYTVPAISVVSGHVAKSIIWDDSCFKYF